LQVVALLLGFSPVSSVAARPARSVPRTVGSKPDYPPDATARSRWARRRGQLNAPLTDVNELERVGPACEARRHRVVVGLEPDAPLCAALATHLIVLLGHCVRSRPGLRRGGPRAGTGYDSLLRQPPRRRGSHRLESHAGRTDRARFSADGNRFTDPGLVARASPRTGTDESRGHRSRWRASSCSRPRGLPALRRAGAP